MNVYHRRQRIGVVALLIQKNRTRHHLAFTNLHTLALELARPRGEQCQREVSGDGLPRPRPQQLQQFGAAYGATDDQPLPSNCLRMVERRPLISRIDNPLANYGLDSPFETLKYNRNGKFPMRRFQMEQFRIPIQRHAAFFDFQHTH